MLFNSFPFLFVFFPLALGGYLLLENRTKNPRLPMLWLLASSLVFYAQWRWQDVGLILASIAFNYLLADRVLSRPALSDRARLNGIRLGVAANLTVLGYFKYFGMILATLGLPELAKTWVPALPLGISFFTFLQIAFLVDCYRTARNPYRLDSYGLFVTVFPHLIAGPLVHHEDLIPQFSRKRDSHKIPADLSVGLSLLAIGLAKKVLIADVLSSFSDPVFEQVGSGQSVDFFTAWMGALGFTFQLYFDFSGYSDMAVGLARCFGLQLPWNFESPYRSGNIIEFWRRWHITLSQFLRDYLYIPLGGNRQGRFRRYVNLMITMLLGGLWHGANWTFVAWGALHGAYLACNHVWRERRLPRVPLSGAFTFAAVTFAWVFFKAPRFGTAFDLIRSMLGFHGANFGGTVAAYFIQVGRIALQQGWGHLASLRGLDMISNATELYAFVAAALIAFFAPNTRQWAERIEQSSPAEAPFPGFRFGPAHAFALGGLFFLALKTIAAAPATPFLYFEF